MVHGFFCYSNSFTETSLIGKRWCCTEPDRYLLRFTGFYRVFFWSFVGCRDASTPPSRRSTTSRTWRRTATGRTQASGLRRAKNKKKTKDGSSNGNNRNNNDNDSNQEKRETEKNNKIGNNTKAKKNRNDHAITAPPTNSSDAFFFIFLLSFYLTFLLFSCFELRALRVRPTVGPRPRRFVSGVFLLVSLATSPRCGRVDRVSADILFR